MSHWTMVLVSACKKNSVDWLCVTRLTWDLATRPSIDHNIVIRSGHQRTIIWEHLLQQCLSLLSIFINSKLILFNSSLCSSANLLFVFWPPFNRFCLYPVNIQVKCPVIDCHTEIIPWCQDVWPNPSLTTLLALLQWVSVGTMTGLLTVQL